MAQMVYSTHDRWALNGRIFATLRSQSFESSARIDSLADRYAFKDKKSGAGKWHRQGQFQIEALEPQECFGSR